VLFGDRWQDELLPSERVHGEQPGVPERAERDPCAIAEGSCPAAVGSDANNSWKLWPYNVGVGAGTNATPVVDPALGQPPLLLFLGCNSLLQ